MTHHQSSLLPPLNSQRTSSTPSSRVSDDRFPKGPTGNELQGTLKKYQMAKKRNLIKTLLKQPATDEKKPKKLVRTAGYVRPHDPTAQGFPPVRTSGSTPLPAPAKRQQPRSKTTLSKTAKI